MNLRTKVFLYVGGTLLILFFGVYTLLTSVLTEDFKGLEKVVVEENVRRVTDAFDNKIDDLVVKVSDWGQWDDTYAFVQDGNQDYVDANLQNVALTLLNIRFVVITDENGSILFKKEVNADGEEVEFSKAFEEFIKTHPILTQHEDSAGVTKGLVSLPEGVVVTVARAVTSSDGLSPVKGTIMFAFFVDDAIDSKLAELTHLRVTLEPRGRALEQPDFALAMENLTEEGEVFVGPRNNKDQDVRGYALKKDLDNEKALFIRVDMERSLYQHGQKNIALFTKIMIGASFFVIGAVLLLFEYLVLRRLFSLGRAVEEVSERQDSQAQIMLLGNDEFSALAERINTMLQSLRDMEVKRKESEKRFRTVADSAPVMIWMSDENKKSTYMNKVWLDFTGRSLEEELGEGWKTDVHPDDLKMTNEIYEAAFAKQQPFNVEYRLRRKDGTYGWVFARAIPHFTQDGVFLGYVGSCVDISERKQVEDQRQGYIEEIENMNRIMVERELKMVELKDKIKQLEAHGKA